MTEPMTEPNNDRTEPVSDSVLAEATEWYCRVEAAPYDDALREELEAWLAADERHARAWGLTARAWEASGGVRAEFAHLWENPEPVAGPRAGPGRASWRRRAAFAAAALAACLVLAVALPDLLLRAGADIHTGAGETREIALEDGSVVHLGADSAISVAFTPDRRGLKLLHGEAFFRVAKNGVRPFVVGAEDRGIFGVRPRRVDGEWSVERIWRHREVSLDMSSPVVLDGAVYGFSEFKTGQLFCLDPMTGKVHWTGEPRGGDNAQLLSVAGHALVLNDRGDLQVLRANRERCEVVRRYQVAEDATWAAPALLGDALLVKDRTHLALWRFPARSEE